LCDEAIRRSRILVEVGTRQWSGCEPNPGICGAATRSYQGGKGVTVSGISDRGFEDELAAVLNGPLPPEVRNTVEELLTWRAVDADLRELLSRRNSIC
jgi:hypothetical protein